MSSPSPTAARSAKAGTGKPDPPNLCTPVSRAGLSRRNHCWNRPTAGACWSLYRLAPLRHWSEGPIALLGDAAHPVLPFLAQGAALAIEDAVTLAACLRSGPRRCIVLAFPHYEALRRARAARVQRLARRYGLALPSEWSARCRPQSPARAAPRRRKPCSASTGSTGTATRSSCRRSGFARLRSIRDHGAGNAPTTASRQAPRA